MNLGRWMDALPVRMRSIFRRARAEQDLNDELSFHLTMHARDAEARGLSLAEAERRARISLQGLQQTRERSRDTWPLGWLDDFRRDFRYAIRGLVRSPGFAAAAILSLALGIGANTALFSLVDGLLLRSLPVAAPDRLVQVQEEVGALGLRKVGYVFPKPVFDYTRAHNDVFSEIVGFQPLDRPLVTIDGVAEPPRQVEQVSETFFADLGIVPIVGRVQAPSDDAVAIISAGLWRGRFASSPDVAGRSLSVDGRSYSIVGVAPPRFHGLSIERSVDVWIPSPAAGFKQMVTRLKPGVTAAQAQAQLAVLFSQLAREQPGVLAGRDNPNMPTPTITLVAAGKGLSQLRGQYERPLMALSALVVVVLLITCTNVGNLLMVRNTARRRELTVRVALGAPRSRLVLQYLVESAVVAGMGGILGLVFARWGVLVALSMLPLPVVPESLAFQLDARVLGFAAAVSLLSALLFGLVPAWRATHVELTGALRAGDGGSPSAGTRRLGRALVACQVALSVVLLVGAGLFVQTLRNLTRIDVGFSPDNLLQVSIDTRGAGYRQGQVGGVYRLLLERVSAVPGVRSVTGIRNGVMQGGLSRTLFSSLGPNRPLGPEDSWDSVEVGPSFFETMNIRLLKGRTFTATDFADTRTLFIVSDAFVKRFFPKEDPIGQLGGALIGVVADTKLATVRREAGPMMYFKAPPEPDRLNALEVRATGDPTGIANTVREEIRRINPRLLVDVKTLRRQIAESISTERMVATTSGFFSLLGVVLASIGIFGVASYTVAQRTRELGIRMALGAGRWSVIREGLRDTMLVCIAGLTAGVLAAVAAVRLTAGFVSNLLFGLTATDLANIVVAVLLMAAVALAACILPARRATRIDLLTAIRDE